MDRSENIGRTFALLTLTALGLAGCQGPGTAPPSEEAGPATTARPAVRTVEFVYEAVIRDVPETADSAFLWVPVPPSNEDQTVHSMEVEAPFPYVEVTDPEFGNRALRFEVPAGTPEGRAVVRLRVTRRERIRRPGGMDPPSDVPPPDQVAQWLEPDRRVPINDQIREWAQEAVDGITDPVGMARSIYDYAVTNLRYDKSGTGWGQGDIYWACDAKRGNCTDFHSLFIGYARAMGIPARFEMGFPLPPDRGEGEVAGYHCWAQFYTPEWGWIPVDASEANKHPDKREYFFGAHDENRILFTVGRDIVLPGMQGDPLNFFIYPYAEVDGRPWENVDRRFTYKDLTEAGH